MTEYSQIIHKQLSHMRYLWVIFMMMFSALFGYHHHHVAHICLGWEHILHQNSCHQGGSCSSCGNSQADNHCNYSLQHSTVIAKKQTDIQQKQHLQKHGLLLQNTKPILLSCTKKIHLNHSPRSPDEINPKGYGLRAPPAFWS